MPRVREEIGGVELQVIRMTARCLLYFMIFAISLELLDLVFRGYTAVKTWDALRSVIYGKDFSDIFILQYGIGAILPFVLFLLPNPTIPRTVVGLVLVLFGVFMMRWNVVIGGQSFSLTLAGYMEYRMPIIPHSLETFKEGLAGALVGAVLPFIIFWAMSRILPVFGNDPREDASLGGMPTHPVYG
jgi:predicted membrane protein